MHITMLYYSTSSTCTLYIALVRRVMRICSRERRGERSISNLMEAIGKLRMGSGALLHVCVCVRGNGRRMVKVVVVVGAVRVR